ncbi:t-SNARE [Aspergillus filifer]
MLTPPMGSPSRTLMAAIRVTARTPTTKMLVCAPLLPEQLATRADFLDCPEMNPVQPQPADQGTLLNEIQKIKEGVASLRALREGRLAVVLNAQLEAVSTQEDLSATAALDEIQGEFMTIYRKLLHDVKRIKETPGSASVQSQLEVQSRNVKREFEDHQAYMLAHSRRLKEQLYSRYKRYNPDATHEEAQAAVEGIIAGTTQQFQVTGARTKQANDARDHVMKRSQGIQKIEKDLIPLSEMVNQLAELVMQQQEAVDQIDRGAENVAQDLGNANVQLGQAVESARKARRWKWYALIIVIIIIAIIVAVAVGVTQSK